MTVVGRTNAERKEVGEALLKEILILVQAKRAGESVIASIGLFDLEHVGGRGGKDGYRFSTALMRNGR